MSEPRKPLIPLDDALASLLAQITPLAGTETVATADARGRVLAEGHGPGRGCGCC